ncbi:hypothetical protein [Bradyrhizobium sp.]|uniref:hypothetical protein n=1 Tax=Bradyrhizobium sp. TaxID=376 RepID=UPI001ED089E6|nr:hypothetical protein [Bradyrhizobium sp.]MBV8920759.1 hypothetical protein [Bradyrhizobium sp.]MBV9983533.1 hypothetical protein [Bradyrhizobium sp.]
MPHASKIALAALLALLAGLSNPAEARGRHYPLTRCGPDLESLCPIHGSFDGAPFHYHVAVYPGCVRVASVETRHGLRHRPVLVCDVVQRPMIWW